MRGKRRAWSCCHPHPPNQSLGHGISRGGPLEAAGGTTETAVGGLVIAWAILLSVRGAGHVLSALKSPHHRGSTPGSSAAPYYEGLGGRSPNQQGKGDLPCTAPCHSKRALRRCSVGGLCRCLGGRQPPRHQEPAGHRRGPNRPRHVSAELGSAHHADFDGHFVHFAGILLDLPPHLCIAHGSPVYPEYP